MASRLESRVAKLEHVKDIGKNAVIIFCRNVEHETIIQNTSEAKIMKSGNFYKEGSGRGDPMNLEKMREYLAKGKYQAITLLPLKDIEK